MRIRTLIGGALAAFGLASLGGAAILAWHLREQTRAFFTDADTIDRPAGETSPRDILWRNPSGLPATVDGAGTECAPATAADGQVLYFARRVDGRGFDLFVTARTASGWSEAQPVEALNSDGDEIDPHVSADGRRIYFASDRPGGLGRFDLWTAVLDEPGPAAPANLGRLVNGAGNECGPALDPAGSAIYFASDREPEHVPGGAAARPRRAGEPKDFDLFAARIDVPGPAEAVAALNSEFQETTPAVSPAGDFVYFASDRPGGSGAFDLFRSRRVRGEHAPPESLGPPVNTAHDELDPEVVLEGFGLYFVSRAAGRGDEMRYTASREVFRRTEAWRAALRWKAVWAALWPYACWVLGASFLLFLLGKYFAHLRYRTLSLFARCIMGSLLGHLVLLAAFAYWIVSVPEPEGPGDEGILVSFDLPFPGEGLALTVQGAGTGAAPAAALQAAASPMPAWTGAGEAPVPAVAAAPSLLEPAGPGAAAAAPPAAAAPDSAALSAAADVDPVPALDAGLPAAVPGASPEPAIIVREPAGAAFGRMEPEAGVAAGGEAAPAGAAAPAHLAGGAVLPPGSPEFAAAPPAAAPGPAPGDAARPRGAMPVPALRLPQGGGAAAPAGAAAEPVVPAVVLPSERASGAAFAGTGGAGANSGHASVPGAGHTEGTAFAPGVTAPSAASAPRAAGSGPAPGSGSRGAAAEALRVEFPALAVSPSGGAGAGAHAGQGPAGPPGGGAPPARAGFIAAAGGGTAGSAVEARPTGAASLAGAAPAGPSGALPRSASAHVALPGPGAGMAPARGTGLDLRLPEAGAPPEDYANRAPEIREVVLGETGGSAATERAVEIALDWLSRHQSEEGRWDGTGYDRGCGQCPGRQRVTCDTALTGLALLSFLGAGHTHFKEGPYRDAVRRGLDWLVGQQAADGGLIGGESMYSHGIASIALAEAYGMSRDPLLERPVRAAVEFIDAARNRRVGGWRYRPGQPGDTSIMGWQVMALKSARVAGIEVPQEAFDAAAHWLDIVHQPERIGTYAYQPHAQVTPAMTAEGMFIAQLLGAGRGEPRMRGSASFIMEHMPSWKPDANTYYWYYATLALFQHQGEEWNTWNEAVKDVLLERQETEGAGAGSWAPDGQWATVAGRVYQTAMAALILEVYYRYLPRYVQDPNAAAP
jgi:hypothetical protein